jgi:hypothetical protein
VQIPEGQLVKEYPAVENEIRFIADLPLFARIPIGIPIEWSPFDVSPLVLEKSKLRDHLEQSYQQAKDAISTSQSLLSIGIVGSSVCLPVATHVRGSDAQVALGRTCGNAIASLARYDRIELHLLRLKRMPSNLRLQLCDQQVTGFDIVRKWAKAHDGDIVSVAAKSASESSCDL